MDRSTTFNKAACAQAKACGRGHGGTSHTRLQGITTTHILGSNATRSACRMSSCVVNSDDDGITARRAICPCLQHTFAKHINAPNRFRLSTTGQILDAKIPSLHMWHWWLLMLIRMLLLSFVVNMYTAQYPPEPSARQELQRWQRWVQRSRTMQSRSSKSRPWTTIQQRRRSAARLFVVPQGIFKSMSSLGKLRRQQCLMACGTRQKNGSIAPGRVWDVPNDPAAAAVAVAVGDGSSRGARSAASWSFLWL